jgi:signal recognition particle GTPase
MIPGFREMNHNKNSEDAESKFKQILTVMDSMTDEELDFTDFRKFNVHRLMRIAKGSGISLGIVQEHIKMCKSMSGVVKKSIGLRGAAPSPFQSNLLSQLDRNQIRRYRGTSTGRDHVVN